MNSNKATHLKLFTGEDSISVIEALVEDFIHQSVDKNKSLSEDEASIIKDYFDNFMAFCSETASDKVVLDNGRMMPLIHSR